MISNCYGVFLFFFQNAEAHNVIMILKAYRRVLKHGKSYLFHVMPRMLSIWLDYTQKMVIFSFLKNYFKKNFFPFFVWKLTIASCRLKMEIYNYH